MRYALLLNALERIQRITNSPMKGTKPPLGPESGGTFLAAFEYSDKLNQQVLSLEADNVELQDGKKLLEAENQALKAGSVPGFGGFWSFSEKWIGKG